MHIFTHISQWNIEHMQEPQTFCVVLVIVLNYVVGSCKCSLVEDKIKALDSTWGKFAMVDVYHYKYVVDVYYLKYVLNHSFGVFFLNHCLVSNYQKKYFICLSCKIFIISIAPLHCRFKIIKYTESSVNFFLCSFHVKDLWFRYYFFIKVLHICF